MIRRRNKNYLVNDFKGEDSNNQSNKRKKKKKEKEKIENKISSIFVFYFVVV